MFVTSQYGRNPCEECRMHLSSSFGAHMRRTVLIVLISIALWFGLKDWVYRTLYSMGEAEQAEALSYSDASNWALRPEAPPPGAWERPWGVDVYLLLPPSTSPARHGVIGTETASFAKDMERTTIVFADLLANAGPVYTPLYRQASPALLSRAQSQGTSAREADAKAAFAHYLSEDNRQRAILFAVAPGAEPLVPIITARTVTDPRMADRIVGIVYFGTGSDDVSIPPCSPVFEDDCLIRFNASTSAGWLSWLKPNLPVKRLRYRLGDNPDAAIMLSARSLAVSEWLDEHAPKPAEPLGDFETIEIAPIRRPGEVDEPPTD
ncbi:MAG: DUF3089 domain-containing protein, partial [Hyphomonadaceae bacterium]